MSLIDGVSRIYRVLKQHIGYGGNAHSVVDDYNDGFMSTEQKKEFDRIKGYPRINLDINKGIDILQLEPGRYEGSGLINSPLAVDDLAWLEIDITYSKMSWESNYRKQIFAMNNSNGAIFYRTIHSNGTPESGTGKWVRLVDEDFYRKNLSHRRRSVAQGTDILSLDAGLYEGNTLVNSPLGNSDNSWQEIDVTVSPIDTVSGLQRKQIKLMKNVTGEIFYRTIHTDGTPTSGTNGWFKVTMSKI